jgi:purine-binding chemotaxis protein CheW
MTHEFLIFGIGNEDYAVDILTVKEIRSYSRPTAMANSPVWLKGIIDLRGSIVPIIDTRIKFGFEDVTYTETTIVIVMTKGTQDFGLVVDRVVEVDSFSEEEIQDPPEMEGSVISSHTVTGLCSKKNKGLVIILDAASFITDIQT